MEDDLEQLRKVQTQLNNTLSIVLRKRHEIMKNLPEEEKQNIFQFEKDYRKLMKAGDPVGANTLKYRILEKYNK